MNQFTLVFQYVDHEHKWQTLFELTIAAPDLSSAKQAARVLAKPLDDHLLITVKESGVPV